jgi:type II secretory pathway pseudopilin PulG
MKRAFTMVETIAVFTVVAVLLFVGFSALNRSETKTGGIRYQQELRQFSASLAHFQLSRGYFPSDNATLQSLEPGATFIVDGAALSAGQFAVSVGTISGVSVLGIATVTEDGLCYTMTQPPLDDDSINPATAEFEPSEATPCSGTTALAQIGTAW